jgi:hypothetical protein
MISILETLNWANLGNISKPLTPLQIKTAASVLTEDGVGCIICPKCNILNRDIQYTSEYNFGFGGNQRRYNDYLFFLDGSSYFNKVINGSIYVEFLP